MCQRTYVYRTVLLICVGSSGGFSRRFELVERGTCSLEAIEVGVRLLYIYICTKEARVRTDRENEEIRQNICVYSY